MENTQDLQEILETYLSRYPQEMERQRSFKEFIEHTPFEDLYHRKNFNGHITASAFIVDQDHAQMLLIHHKGLNRWLQPGGHVDYTDASILAAAFRETLEETNIDERDLEWIRPSFPLNIPVDIDSHVIPENELKQEKEHVHHDFRFLFLYKGGKNVQINPSEVTHYQWQDIDALSGNPEFAGLAEKIWFLLQR
ncbi:MAG: NUDIX hydrolase [Haliscomenobacter sp.]|nr:NUDIX hydrolase [Haliscomenobacter sp.]MBK8877874.1 NUDIX hydrolase [Haliscomenobacter sp.]